MLTKNPYLNDAGLTSDDFDGIVERYRGMLSAIGHQFRLTPEEREDATQSTWLQLFRNIEQIRNLDLSAAGWPQRCAANAYPPLDAGRSRI
jgi:DNA-directed RNA polymerase specialized sigma24 family protein